MRTPARTLLRIAAVAAIAVAAGLVVRHRRSVLAAAPRDNVGPIPVRTAIARTGAFELMRDYVAVVEPQRSTEVAARLTARVLSVAVREGDAVAAGDVLAALQADDLQAALDTARALVAASDADVASQEATLAALEHSLAYLRKEWDRATGLRESGAATDQQVDAARERFDDASGRLVAARGRLAALQQASAAAQARQRDAVLRIEQDSRLLCDAAGIVTSRQVEPGDLAVPGRTLLVVASNGLRLAFDVPQDDMATVTPGKVVSWTEPAPGGSGAVTRVHPAFAANRMRRAEVDLDAKDAAVLAIGSYVPLHLSAQRIEDATIIPAQALVTSPDAHSYVFAVEGGALHAVPVETLGRSGEDVAVRGLPPGAAVVLNSYLGWTTLGGGRAVEVIQ